MHNAPSRTVFGVITDFLAGNPSPEEIIAYRLPDNMQARAHELLEKNGEGELTEREHAEMMDIARMENMMMLLKAKTKRKLQQDAE